MFVRTLRLKNFRSHQETVLELDRLNFVRGPNSCGKSSIRMALEYLFTGSCGLTDSAGRGAEALIRAGEEEFTVSATLANGESISRRRTRRSQTVEINGKRMPVDVAAALVVQRFASGDVMAAVLNADQFSEMSAAEQQRFLGQLVEVRQIEIPGEVRRALDAIDEEVPRPKSLADLLAAYKRFNDLRAETNHALESLGCPRKAEGGPSLFSHTALGDQAVASGQHTEKTEEPSSRQPRPQSRRGFAENRTTQTEAEFDESSFEVPGLWEEDELLRLDSPAEHAKELRRQLAELTSEQETVGTYIAVMQGSREKCPTCGQAISEATKTREIEGSRKKLDELKDLIQVTREELSCYGVPETAVSGRVQNGASSKATHDLGRHANIRNSPVACDPEKFNQSRRGCDGVQHQEVSTGGWEACQIERSALERRLGALEQVIEFFGPNGSISQEAGWRVDRFRQNLDQHLSAFGYACSLTFEPFDLRIASPHGGAALLLRQLSESERFRFGIVFQIALAATTGLRFVVVDRADMLDKTRRQLLTALLLSSDLDQALVLATAEDSVPAQLPEGVKFLDLSDQIRT